MARAATMTTWRSGVPARVVVLVLHGGAECGHRPVRPWGLAYLRMVPFAHVLHRAGTHHGVEVVLLRNRKRGWNEPDMDPVVDARWALREIHAEHPEARVVLVGHSMGGRVALRVADDPAVAGVCALAPWTPRGEPVEPVAGRAVLIAHGSADGVTSPAHSRAYAARADEWAARLTRFEITDADHPMVRRARSWTELVRGFVLDVAGIAPAAGPLAAAWGRPGSERLHLPLRRPRVRFRV